MKFTPKTKEEIQQVNLIQEGYYNFLVIEAVEKISQNGNPMIELKLKIWDQDNKERIVFDRIMEAFAQKLRGFAYAVGKEVAYEQGELTQEECKYKEGRLHLVISPARKDKKTGKEYPTRNEVKQYYQINDQNASETGVIDDKIEF